MKVAWIDSKIHREKNPGDIKICQAEEKVMTKNQTRPKGQTNSKQVVSKSCEQ